MERLDRPPTWRSAFNRAAIAAVIVGILAVVALGNTPLQAAVLAVIMLVIYVPLGYAFDTFVYRLRQRRKQGQGQAGADAHTQAGGESRRGRERAR
jgi:membrane protein implicated in regulation of membrane protease activity